MTIRFRIDQLTLRTTEGNVRYDFRSELTILSGPTGVGKTTLLELIKFAFAAGDARLAAVATDYVTDVVVDITVGQDRLRLARSVDPGKRKKIRVTDLLTQERMPDHHAGDDIPSINTLLLTKLGLPSDMRAAAQKGKSSKAGNRVTFADIYKYVYIPQYAMNRDIAGSQDDYYTPKRIAVFELLFGLTEPDILALQSEVNLLNGEIEKQNSHIEAVKAFLRDSQTTGRLEAERDLMAAVAAQAQAEAERDSIREEIDPVIDRETQALRDLLADAERSLADAHAAKVSLSRQKDEYAAERDRVHADLARLARMQDAGMRLANIEFAVCPRCMQSLNQRNVPSDSCRVCLQTDPVEGLAIEDQYETRQLNAQLQEMDDQIDVTQEQLEEVTRAIVDREQLIRNLTASLDMRTSHRVTPRLQAFSDASERLAAARARQEQFEALLRQWDRVADLEAERERLKLRQESLRADIKSRKAALEERKRVVLGRLGSEFRRAVIDLRIAAVESASVDPDSYLPTVNGKVYGRTAIPGGGAMTAIQIAYWTSLMTVALGDVDTRYPTLLILDGPRLALNTAEDTCAAIYGRLASQASANAGRVQIIISDNEIPFAYRNGYPLIEFDYSNPTISPVRHPGKANVELIVTEDETS
ncbi:hypothetical protein GCM10023195_82920 [Actinoallomurus liliacearum]|uniref:Rad50/SbcC-type AAA domain-containing protein n=1 Tax=Actinoallomurus liliacearum TaxID=1080073 RepID=A0ABP8U1U9_9ACTN